MNEQGTVQIFIVRNGFGTSEGKNRGWGMLALKKTLPLFISSKGIGENVYFTLSA